MDKAFLDAARRYTAADFERFWGGTDFCSCPLQALAPQKPQEGLCIAEGRLKQCELRPGMRLVLADIAVHHWHECPWALQAGFSAFFMLRGHARMRLAQAGCEGIGAQGGLAAVHGAAAPLFASYPAGQRLCFLGLSLEFRASQGDPDLEELLASLLARPRLSPWFASRHLADAAAQLLDGIWHGALHGLMCDGVGLHLLAHALEGASTKAAASAKASAKLSLRDRVLLERVRGCLHEMPEKAHTLAELAQLACMSPGTLQGKFQEAYGQSVFEWLRNRRLEVARDRLAQGCSVQQAAHFAGYCHATNFATAFRKRYGVAPSKLVA
jgi:AraC-like DNA-binding protein